MIIPYPEGNLYINKMNKPVFRAKHLEVSKPMPIYMSEELPGLPEYSEITRAVPQMPSGMKKEEECEHHLQRAIVRPGLIIPTPDVVQISDMTDYNHLYAPNYKVPRQLIHMQPFSMEEDIPDYDMDSEDEKWLVAHSKVMDITALKFEEMMDRLEKNSGHSAVNQKEAKALLKENDDLIIAVYDYWLNKRLKTEQSLIPCVKTEANRGKNSINNPYLAFQRRVEKKQTRTLRKNDESTYGKMLKLKRDLSRALSLLEFVKKRETSKREVLRLTVDIFEKRYQAQDFSGQLLSEVSAMKASRPAFAPIFTNQYNNGSSWSSPIKDDYVLRKEKRQYKKRKHKKISVSVVPKKDDYRVVAPTSPLKEESPFTFWRNRQCAYSSPVLSGSGNWPWCSHEEGGLADQRYKFSLTSISPQSLRCIGLARRRIGRGGRVILDRAGPPMDDYWASLDFTIQDNCRVSVSDDKPAVTGDDRLHKESCTDHKLTVQNRDTLKDCIHYRPRALLKSEDSDEEPFDVMKNSNLSLTIEDLTDPTDELTPVQLSLSELFPTLDWNKHELDIVSKSEENYNSVFEPSISKEKQNMRQTVIDRKEYQSGSLLDRWARFESPPPQPAKKTLSIESSLLLDGDYSGCSAFRTTDVSLHPGDVALLESSRIVSSMMLKVSNGLAEGKPYLHSSLTSAAVSNHKFNNLTGYKNGTVHSKLVGSSLLSKHLVPIASCRKKNNHFNSRKLHNKIIMRIPKNKEEVLDSPQMMTKEVDPRKPTQVFMEVT